MKIKNNSELKILLNIIQEKFSIHNFKLFAEYFFKDCKTILEYRPIGNYKNIESCLHIAEYDFLDIFAIALNDVNKSNKSLERRFVSELLSTINKQIAIVAFYNQDENFWRLSYIKVDEALLLSDLKFNLTPVKRCSYLIGKEEPSHLITKYFYEVFKRSKFKPTAETLDKAFNVEVVSKDFFKEYNLKCKLIKQHLDSDTVFVEQSITYDFTSEQFSKKLMNQLAFFYFLQKKSWLGNSKTFIRDLFNKCQNQNFYEKYLKVLFYRALKSENNYHNIFNCEIPFLNENLFNHIDGYDYNDATIELPNSLFSNENKNGILDFFDKYNFTINESIESDLEIAIDPEMLGKIFESLLEIEERKSKGVYYTPKQIVDYMCTESLINYISDKLKLEIHDVRAFILDGEFIKDEDSLKNNKNENSSFKLPKSIYDNLKLIDNELKEISVLEPAVGSGAFVLGMLYQIVRIRNNITYYLINQFEDIETRKALFKKRCLYNLKSETIENCIFAIDIDKNAVEITKLRLWLSLIVDDFGTVPKPLIDLDYNIIGENLKFLIGVLNSHFGHYVFKNFYAGAGLGNNTYRYKKCFLKNFPMPKVKNDSDLKLFESLVDEILHLNKYKDFANVKNIEIQLDDLVYKFFELTNKEIELIENSRTPI